MPSAVPPNEPNWADENEDGSTDHTLLYNNWRNLNTTSIGISFRTGRNGVVIPRSLRSAGPNPYVPANDASRAARRAAMIARRDEVLRRRIEGEIPVRYTDPNRPWDYFVQLWNDHARAGQPIEPTPFERALRAAEITLPRHLDVEPPHNTWPIGWDIHHDYFLWTCRGTVPAITQQLQMIFRFEPPICETFVADRLSGVNAFRQLTFLRTYLPGETHSMQRAIARGVLYEAGISDPEVRGGFQDLDVVQHNPGDGFYPPPLFPRWGHEHWHRIDDAFIAWYIGEHPNNVLREYSWGFPFGLSLEFVRVRMAQVPYSNLSIEELTDALDRRNIFREEYPQYFRHG